jgi:hypothetical protein
VYLLYAASRNDSNPTLSANSSSRAHLLVCAFFKRPEV